MNIPFPHGLSFAFGKPTFSGSRTQKNYVGWEFTEGSLRIQALDELLPHHRVTLLPVFENELSWAVLLRNIIEGASANVVFDRVLVDWPQVFQPHLKNIVTSFPENLCLADPELTKPYFFEALNNIRRALFSLTQNNDDLFNCITCVGNLDFGAPFKRVTSLSTELALESGLISFLQWSVQDQGEHSNLSDELVSALVKTLNENKNQKILILAPIHTFIGLSHFLKKFVESSEARTDEFLQYVVPTDLKKVRYTQHALQSLQLSRLSPASASDICDNPGFMVRQYIEKSDFTSGLELFRQGFAKAFQNTLLRYTEWTRLSISQSQERDTFRYVYRLAQESGMLLPNTFDMVLAVQSVIDSNFAFEFLKECRDFPTNPKFSAVLPVVDIELEKVFSNVSKMSVKRFETLQKKRLQSKKILKNTTPSQQRLPVQDVSEEKYADNKWVHEDHPYSCSFPSEDIFMENFAFQCRDAAIEKVRAQQTVVTEMKSTLGEGLDIRETIRNWHQQKLMIREEMMVGKADVGSIVFNFIEDKDADIYSWRTLWLAEPHDKSHLMFYATPFANELIGPGIAKSEFGGLAVIPIESYPVNAWDDPFLKSFCEAPSEALILAGALVTDHKAILYIAPHPPAARVTDLLKRSGRSLIYQPISEISSESIRRIRTFHILAEAGVRAYADKYIRKT